MKHIFPSRNPVFVDIALQGFTIVYRYIENPLANPTEVSVSNSTNLVPVRSSLQEHPNAKLQEQDWKRKTERVLQLMVWCVHPTKGIKDLGDANSKVEVFFPLLTWTWSLGASGKNGVSFVS